MTPDSPPEATLLLREADELTAIVTASGRTARASLRKPNRGSNPEIRNHPA